ncbi:MAG: hypothetical protein SGPRY_003392 [Prymnesium sp.]
MLLSTLLPSPSSRPKVFIPSSLRSNPSLIVAPNRRPDLVPRGGDKQKRKSDSDRPDPLLPSRPRTADEHSATHPARVRPLEGLSFPKKPSPSVDGRCEEGGEEGGGTSRTSGLRRTSLFEESSPRQSGVAARVELSHLPVDALLPTKSASEPALPTVTSVGGRWDLSGSAAAPSAPANDEPPSDKERHSGRVSRVLTHSPLLLSAPQHPPTPLAEQDTPDDGTSPLMKSEVVNHSGCSTLDLPSQRSEVDLDVPSLEIATQEQSVEGSLPRAGLEGKGGEEKEQAGDAALEREGTEPASASEEGSPEEAAKASNVPPSTGSLALLHERLEESLNTDHASHASMEAAYGLLEKSLHFSLQITLDFLYQSNTRAYNLLAMMSMLPGGMLSTDLDKLWTVILHDRPAPHMTSRAPRGSSCHGRRSGEVGGVTHASNAWEELMHVLMQSPVTACGELSIPKNQWLVRRVRAPTLALDGDEIGAAWRYFLNARIAPQDKLGLKDHFSSAAYTLDALTMLEPEMLHFFAEEAARHFCRVGAEVVDVLERCTRVGYTPHPHSTPP